MMAQEFLDTGFALISGVLTASDCDDVAQHVARLAVNAAGSRNLLAQPWCRDLALALKAHRALAPLLPRDARAVQCTLFEKSADKNWGVGLHQDLSIPVRERVDAATCGGWTHKEGVFYTQPPSEVLEELVAIRLHLDPCPYSAGPLRVVPCSHRAGRVSDTQVAQLRAQHGEVECPADRGAALVMRPLLLHASSRLAGTAVRRVLHFLYGPRQLPYGLWWHEAV